MHAENAKHGFGVVYGRDRLSGISVLDTRTDIGGYRLLDFSLLVSEI